MRFFRLKWLLHTLQGIVVATLLATNAVAQETYLDKEKVEELVTYFRGQAELARHAKARTSGEYYVSAFEGEYFDNLISVFEQNATVLEKRESVSERKVTEYFASIDEDLKAFAWMPELKNTVAYHLKLIATPGLDQEQIEKFYRQQRINGEDPQLFYDRVSRYSRPEALELDDVELVITGGEEIDPQKDYWIGQSAPVEFTLSNTGADDANTVELAFQTAPLALDGVLGNGLSCKSIDTRQGTASCTRDVLEAGSAATTTVEIRTEAGRGQLNAVWRTSLDLVVRAESLDPQYQAQKQVSMRLRACVKAYDQALRPLPQPFRQKLDQAISPNPRLPGKALFELSSGKPLKSRSLFELPTGRQMPSSSRVAVDARIYALISYLQINRGIDSDLKWLDLSYGPYAPIKTVALQLPRTLVERSRPGHHCQDPAAEIAALRSGVLSALHQKGDEIRHFHRLLVLAANQRMQELQFALEVGQEGTAEGETLKGASQELVFKVLETAMKDLAPYSDDLATFLKMNAIARTAGRGSTLLSFIEIFRATRALYYVLPEWWDPEYSLALMESLPYMARLAERYEDLAMALDEYLLAIEEAHQQSCTCQAPF